MSWVPSSLLPAHPDLGNHGKILECSYDTDLLLQPITSKQAALLHEAIGQGSLFHEQYGYQADILLPAFTDTLHPDWKSRATEIANIKNCFALHPLDLALAKVCLGRPKDLALCKNLIELNIVSSKQLREALSSMPLQEAQVIRAFENLKKIYAA